MKFGSIIFIQETTVSPKQHTLGSLALRLKSYVISVEYKSSWPGFELVDYQYHDIHEALTHLKWLGEQMNGQNGEGAIRKNVVLSFSFAEHLRSKDRDKKLPPIKKFVAPVGRNRPEGGKFRPPWKE